MKVCFFFYMIVFSVFAHAQVHVVSDIDDTLKASNVRSRKSSFLFAYATQNLINGMPELYNHLSASVDDLSFTYLSSAPKRLMKKSHEVFLEKNKFPLGEIVLRRSLSFSSYSHKFKSVEKIIRSHKPKTLILVGDNGEGDSEVFNAIFQKYGDQLQIYQFIRRTYATTVMPLTQDQIEFVSPLEICLSLEQESLAFCPDSIVETILSEILKEEKSEDFGAYYFHPYMNCAGYHWPSLLEGEAFYPIKNLLEGKCSHNFKSSSNVLVKF